MKKFALILMICCNSLYVGAQNSIRVNLTKISGNLTATRTFGQFLKNNVGFKLDTLNYKLYGVWRFDFDLIQSAINRSKISVNNGSYKNDDLTQSDFSNATHVLAAVKKNGQFILIPDIDGDKSFLNDREYYYRSDPVPADSLKMLTLSLPVFDFKIPTSYKGTTRFAQLSIQFIPKSYFGNLKVNLADSLPNTLNIAAGSVDYFAGEFKLSNRTYSLFLQNQSVDARLVDVSSINLLLGEKNTEFTSAGLSNEDLVLTLTDSIPVDNSLYKVTDIDPYGKYLTLSYAGKRSDIGIKAGSLAKTFVGKDILTQKQIDLTSYKGKYVLLDFWGTWCVPCRELEPRLKKLYNEYGVRNLEIVGISYDKNIGDVTRYLQTEKILWKNVFQSIGSASTQNSIISDYKITSFPTSILIDQHGKIIFRGQGVVDFTKIEELIRENMN